MNTTSHDGGQRRWWRIPAGLLLLIVAGLFAYLSFGTGSLTTPASAAVTAANGQNASGPASVRGTGLGSDQTQVKVQRGAARVVRDEHHDISPPLRDIPPAPPVTRQEGPENPLPPFHPSTTLKDTVVQRFFGPLVMPTPILTFEGIGQANSFCSCLPPDTNGDVGPNHYVQTVNLAFEIWDKNGTVVQASRATNTLWSGFGGSCQTHNDGDPVVNYDPLADRWVISQFTSSAPYYQCVAVSTSPDPTGSYYRYAFLESNTDLYDYPKMGVWPDGYYMTANVFSGGVSYAFPAMMAMDRARMLQGLSATSQLFNPGNFYSGLLPADLDGSTPPPAGAPEPFVTVANNNTVLHLWQFHVDWANPASSVLTGAIDLPAAPWDPNLCGSARNCVPQPGVAASSYLDTVANQTMFRLAYRLFADHDSLVTNESVDVNGGDQAAVRC
jgi:hypothetical protein